MFPQRLFCLLFTRSTFLFEYVVPSMHVHSMNCSVLFLMRYASWPFVSTMSNQTTRLRFPERDGSSSNVLLWVRVRLSRSNYVVTMV
ncbi:hypothetical protein M501DRAFT_428902 [Patellaria atrata CBS 101060]|uniref:Secreted protein n=1 Tax=Patellaria atrata CBS 101060 TaxID=1346257 RepID=A0A9P4SHC1_9PEZI|nr:hypothetical protein M501DRAFT_428902 [Patellaria atrata CBS 101060]